MTTPIFVCADDYGLTPGISKAIRNLAEAGRLSATSAMTVSPYWEAEGRILREFRGKSLAVGLHFTLTELGPLAALPKLAPDGRFPGLGPIMKRALLRTLPKEDVRKELEAQLDRFEAVMGSPPDYIDGHHHAHNLPIVRDVVLEVAPKRLGRERVFLRYCDEPLGAIIRRGGAVTHAVAISLLGHAMAQRGRAAGFAGNTGFRGVRNFSESEDVRRLFADALTDPQPNMMIMCHPGNGDSAPDVNDIIGGCRKQEYDFLRSDAWPDMLRRAGVELRRPEAP
jgi:chitin disaccharide deacetylase